MLICGEHRSMLMHPQNVQTVVKTTDSNGDNGLFPKGFTEFTEFSDKMICHYSKRAQTCHSATSCVRDPDATTAPARHTWDTRYLNWAQFMLQWFSDSLNSLNSVKALLYFGKTPRQTNHNCIYVHFKEVKCAKNWIVTHAKDYPPLNGKETSTVLIKYFL